MQLKIEVTADDIRQGRRGEASWCPVALAARRYAVVPQDVSVTHTTLWLDRRWYVLPYRVRRWIDRFDRGQFRRPRPFSFTIEL